MLDLQALIYWQLFAPDECGFTMIRHQVLEMQVLTCGKACDRKPPRYWDPPPPQERKKHECPPMLGNPGNCIPEITISSPGGV